MTIYNPNPELYYNIKSEKWHPEHTVGCVGGEEELRALIEIKGWYHCKLIQY